MSSRREYFTRKILNTITMKKYLIFDLDGTLIQSQWWIDTIIHNFFAKNAWEYLSLSDSIFSNTQWTPLRKQLELILGKKHPKIKEYTDAIYILILEHGNHTFFDCNVI